MPWKFRLFILLETAVRIHGDCHILCVKSQTSCKSPTFCVKVRLLCEKQTLCVKTQTFFVNKVRFSVWKVKITTNTPNIFYLKNWKKWRKLPGLLIPEPFCLYLVFIPELLCLYLVFISCVCSWALVLISCVYTRALVFIPGLLCLYLGSCVYSVIGS